ncbi:MAG: HisA/HisF-related TIM barrel protein, partial [Nitrososphaerota archaeon]
RRRILVDVVRSVAMEVDIPFTVGGGIRSQEDAESVLHNGADKVSVNTAAVEDPRLVKHLSEIYGAQCIVVAIDAKRDQSYPSGYQVYTHSGTKPSGLDAVEWARRVERLGAGEILLTSIDRDGAKDGYEVSLTRAVAGAVDIPVIASGGAGAPEHFHQILTEGCADAALAASIFHYNEYTIRVVKEFLLERGVIVRL